MNHNILKSKYQNLEAQYHLTEEKFGKEISEYKISV